MQRKRRIAPAADHPVVDSSMAATHAANPTFRELPLSVAFQRSLQLHARPPCSAAEYQELLDLLQHSEQQVQHGALFSRNEEQDDLGTGTMKYLLIPFFKAETLNTMPQRSATQRLEQVEAARAAYAQFLQQCSQYGLLGESCQQAYEEQESGQAMDPHAARTQKVQRFKRGKAVQGLIQQLEQRQKRADEEAGTEGGPPGGVAGWDEEDERLLWRSQVEAAAIKALDARPMLDQELQLLQRGATQQQHHSSQALADDRSRSSIQQRQQQQQQAAMQQAMAQRLADVAGQLSLMHDKEAARQQVLRPSHILPTLTVEQQGVIELRQAREREAEQRQAEAAAAAAAADMHSDDEDEAAVAKQRAWDDFTDDNPRGWGNSKLRPCA